MTDEKLFQLCQFYGLKAREWRQKFIGLLPEVNKRRLFEKKGFPSIFEFAFKLAGLSEQQVSQALNLEKRFQAKNAGMLKTMLEQGEVSINKLARVASVANEENEEFWVDKVKLLPQKALEVLVRDEKATLSNYQNNELFMRAHSNLSQNSENASANFSKIECFEKLALSDEIFQKLLELHNKGIDINKLLLEFIQERELRIAQEKEKLLTEINAAGSVNSRYIPKAIRQIIQEEHGTKCSISTCRRSAEVIHHSQRFSLVRNHDPKYLAPMCKEHHRIAHSIDIKYQEMQPP